jgi:hypothetical protein
MAGVTFTCYMEGKSGILRVELKELKKECGEIFGS